MTVTEELEKQIRILCALSPTLEWSGVLFYTIEGSFEEKRLNIICKDFLLMDRGNATTTEVDYNTPDVAGYMARNPELLDCYQGLMH